MIRVAIGQHEAYSPSFPVGNSGESTAGSKPDHLPSAASRVSASESTIRREHQCITGDGYWQMMCALVVDMGCMRVIVHD
jgi:hypothetical protein